MTIALRHGGTSPSVVASGRGIPLGATVLTMDGELPVEHLTPGDRIITRDAGMQIVRDVVVHRETCAAVRITGGSLGHNRPREDTVLPANQGVLIRDWRAQALFGKDQAVIPAAKLVDGEYIADAGEQTLTLFELVFDAPRIVYADGLELAAEQPELA